MQTIAERIMQIIDALDINKSEFARKLNVTPAYISKLGKNKTSNPSTRLIEDICEKFNVSEQWLLSGEGDMFIELSRDEELAAFFGRVLDPTEDTFKKRFISALSKLSESQWELLEQIAEQLQKEKD